MEIKETKDITLVGKLGMVSPVKKRGKCNNFYEAKFEIQESLGESASTSSSHNEEPARKKMRLISFDGSLHRELSQASKTKVELNHVQIQKSNRDGNLEIVIRKNSSLKCLNDGNENNPVPENVKYCTVDDILQKCAMDAENVNTKVKITNLGEAEYININDKSCKKVIAIISDSTGCMELVLWNDYGQDLNVSMNVDFTNLTLAEYNGKRYVKYSAFTIGKEIDDGNDIAIKNVESLIQVASVIGVDEVVLRRNCRKCHQEIKEFPKDEIFVTCSNSSCSASVRVSKLKMEISCQLRILIQGDEVEQVISLKPSQVQKLLDGHECITKTDFMNCLGYIDQVNLSLFDGNVVDITKM